MSDALGVRVVVFVLSHLALVDREIRSSNEIEVSKKEPPMIYASADQARMLGLEHLVQKEKESGYSSVHYTIRLRHTSVPRRERPWFELQVRTLAQELWSEIEHHLGYKPGRRSNVSARRQLRILAKHIAAIDEHFNFLYEELNRFQQTVSYSRDDPLSVENLPSVLAEIGLTCAQRDMNNILKLLYSRGLETVGALGTLATPRRLEIIRHTYLSVTGRLPTSLEVIATLAALVGAKTEEEEIERIKSQIAYRWAWDAIRSEHTTSPK
jgi:putative GTP pyrophosphokinase